MMKAILVDDERLALNKLTKLLNDSGLVEVTGTYEYPMQGLEAISQGTIDVVFLDIDMPNMDGLALADRILQIDSRVEVVFVTAYSEYAIEAFDLNAIDYLLKPVRKERLYKTLDRLMNQLQMADRGNKLWVRCFGGFGVSVESVSGTEIKWRTSKAEELFAFLVHHAGESVSRDSIIDNLWADLILEKAIAHFHTTMYYIRKSLSNLGMEGVMHQDKGFYKVDIDKIDCDYYAFRQLTLPVALPDMDGRDSYESLVEKYNGGYLDGHSYDWAQQARLSLEQKYKHILLELQACYLRNGDYASAVSVLQRGLRCNPLDEEIHEKLICVYLLMNDGIAARKQYDILHRKLKAEFGVEPRMSIKALLGMK